MRRFAMIFVVALINSTVASRAETPGPVDAGTVTVQSGKAAPVSAFWNCAGDVIVGSIVAEHGSVIIKKGTQNRCGNPIQAVSTLIYTSEPRFTGTDHIYVYTSVGPAGTQVFEIDVKVH